MNIFDEALKGNNSMDGAIHELGPTQDLQVAMDNFEKRMADPDKYINEWRVILKRRGPRGTVNYINQMTKLREVWKHGMGPKQEERIRKVEERE